MYKRPQRGESEEDLLKLQEEFFRDRADNKIQPAAKFVANTESRESIHRDEKPMEDSISEQLNNTFEAIPTNAAIGEIIEKTSSRNVVQREPVTFAPQNKGFPAAKRRDIPSTRTIIRGSSIFSQQIKRLKKDDAGVSSIPEASSNFKNLPSASYVVTGSDRHDVHQENIDVMSKMTEAEIMEEREKLLSTMDPAIVAFLKSKRHHLSIMNAEQQQTDVEKQNKAAEDVQVGNIRAVSDLLKKPKAERWLHFDKLETNKLAWMKDTDASQFKDKSYEARFDFDGWLLPFEATEINERNRALYHHGEEPDRPGYTLQELFQLCRSNVIQQKITALNSIANLLSLESSGIYDNIIDIPIEQIFFVLRFCLDDNTPSVLNACAKAMRNLFCYLIDETCADSLLAFGLEIHQPSLSAEDNDEDDDETINDQQLAETNLVKCLIRTDILNRIRYIINTVRPPIETVSYCLELLIRLSRDSLRTANLVFNCENLLASVISFFVPKDVSGTTTPGVSYGVPLRQAVKLLRILATRNKQIASDLVYKYNILDPMCLYLSNEMFSTNTNGIQLQIEVLHFWSVLVNYELALDHFRILQPVLLQMLHYHIHNTDLNLSTSYTIQSHVAAILNLIAAVASKRFDYASPYVSALSEQALLKWSSQFGTLNKFLCGKLVIISATLRCLSSIIKHKPGELINKHLQNMVNSKGFKIVTSNIKACSNILSEHEAHKPCKNLVTMEAAVWNTSEHVVPILQTNSCLPFLCSLSSFVEASDNHQLKLALLRNDNVQGYLTLVKDTPSYNLSSNWFTGIESAFILNLLKISVSVQNDVDTAFYFEVAVKCLSIFNSKQRADVEFVLRNVIFNRGYYSHEVLMRNLSIDGQEDILNASVDSLHRIFETYKEVLGLGLNANSGSSDLCVDIKTGNIIPVDWIYSPIVALYSNMQHNAYKPSEEKLTFIVGNCLRWIFIYESFFSQLASLINPVDKFCRLACTFLGSDDLFFVPEIHSLLEHCLKKLMVNGGRDLDFSRSVQGLSNFQDFYTQLLEQYQGVSYGDGLFSNFILIPLMQRQNVRYRKLLWSEYAGVAQICNVTAENLMCPLDMFLDPPETDLSLLKCYRKAIVTKMLPDKSVLNIIANYHVDHFISNKK